MPQTCAGPDRALLARQWRLADCSGVQIKTRKRNIAVAHDPTSFVNAVVVIFEDARDSEDLEQNLQSALKVRHQTGCQLCNALFL